MEVILRENFPTLGYVGDLVNVKRGYARNFLIPRGIAVESSSRNSALLRHKLSAIAARRAKLKVEAEEYSKKLSSVVLEYTLKLGEGGKVFGSIGTKDIEATFKAAGFEISKTQIKLTEAIKKAGEYAVIVKLHADVSVTFPVKVQSETPKKKADAEEGAEKPKRRGRGRKSADAAQEEGAVEAAPKKEGEEK